MLLACETDTGLKKWLEDVKEHTSPWLTRIAPFIENEKVTLIFVSDKRLEFTSCVFDRPLHRYIAEETDKNGIIYMRCLKVMFKLFWPKRMARKSTSVLGYHGVPYVNSHTLKSLVFGQLRECDGTKLSFDDLMPQMKNSMSSTYDNLFGDKLIDVKDPVTGLPVGPYVNKDKHTKINHGDILKVMTDLYEHMKSEVKTDTRKINSFEYKGSNLTNLYFRVHGKFHKACELSHCCLDAALALYRIPDWEAMPLYKHSIIREGMEFRSKQIEKEESFELTEDKINEWKTYCS